MSEKNYSPVEAARKVLEKCQELYNSNKIEKAEAVKEMDKCGDMKQVSKKEKVKKELDKCGDMGKAEEAKEMNPKLKSFIEKRKAKKAAKMEKMMGIGEKAPIAPAAAPNAPAAKPMGSAPKPMAPQAQSAAPVNAPKPALPTVKKSEKKK